MPSGNVDSREPPRPALCLEHAPRAVRVAWGPRTGEGAGCPLGRQARGRRTQSKVHRGAPACRRGSPWLRRTSRAGNPRQKWAVAQPGNGLPVVLTDCGHLGRFTAGDTRKEGPVGSGPGTHRPEDSLLPARGAAGTGTLPPSFRVCPVSLGVWAQVFLCMFTCRVSVPVCAGVSATAHQCVPLWVCVV